MKIMKPSPYQRAILSIPEKYNLLLAGGRGGGKLLDVMTKIPTPSGWSLLKDLSVGDKVFDEQGRQCSITAVFDDIPETAYRLHFSDDTFIDACSEHQWVTWTHAQRKRCLRSDKSPKKGLPADWADAECVTTQEIVDTLRFGKRGDLNHCIPTTGALQTDKIELPIDPYLLGIWLGDGSSQAGHVTTMDPEIVKSFTDLGFELREVAGGRPDNKARTYIVGPRLATYRGGRNCTGKRSSAFTQALSDARLLKNKHVPEVYMRASAEQRLALLQGLMDSDGTAAKDKRRVSFGNTNKLLIDAVLELARSLGEKPIVSEGRAMLYGKDCGPTWNVSWGAKVQCFRLPRKLDRIKPIVNQQSRHMHRMIVDAVQITPVPMRCLTVDSPNHMYLAGEGMIPTHNSIAILMMLMRHAEMYGVAAYALLVRESYESIKQLEEDFHNMLLEAYGTKIGYNKSDHLFKLPSGGKVQFGQLADARDYVKYQGKSYTMLVIDEYGEITNPKYVTLLMSNLRGPKNIPIRAVWAANPGGAQHGFLHYEFIAKSNPWEPFDRNGRKWVVCPSTYQDNIGIDKEAYVQSLRDACGGDEDLLKAWLSGDWNIARGAYFAGALDERVHKLTSQQFPVQKLDKRAWQPFIAADWGSGSPGVAYVCVEAPGDIGPFPKGSLILLDELATHEPNDLNVGLKWGPSKWCEAIKDLCKPWGCPPEGVCDDAAGLEDSLINTMGEYGVYVTRPKKERVAGWQLMRNMLVASKERNGQPGMWVHERCKYFYLTVPFLQRDQKRPEDLITTGPDHAADAARYACMNLGRAAFSTSITGGF
jgi:LAGLIDADG DNA endonuclease family protein